MITLPEIERKQNMLKDAAEKYRLNFRKHYSKISHLEGIVARGDRRVANIIYSAWSQGARFDGWDETFNYSLWVKCVEESGLNTEIFLGTIPMNGKLAWDHIDVGLTERFLEIEWKKATHNRLSPPCGKVYGMVVHHSNLETLEKTFDIDKKKLVCYHCGVACDLKGMVQERRDFLTGMKAVTNETYVPPAVLKKDIAELREKRNQFVGAKYRIEFSKIGPITFISHLDLQKVMQRIFKRARLDTLHSEGYNLRPLLSFGPALTLGISSLTEYFDVRVPGEWTDFDQILKTLHENSEPGIIFKAITAINSKTPSIQDAAKAFTYFIPVKSQTNLKEIVEALKTKEEILIQSYSKKEEVFIQKDIRPLILGLELGSIELDEKIIDIIDEVSPCRSSGIRITTSVKQGTGVRPSEIIELLTSQGLEVERPIKVAIELNY